MTDASLRGDCSRCVGLCCVALAFDRGPQFAFDKAAGEACRHLGANSRCRIHERLDREGFGGCASYDCRGAGQIVTAIFAGHAWPDSPAVARQMFAAFRIVRELQIMRSAVPSGLPRALADRLAPPSGWRLEKLLSVDVAAIRRDLAKFLAADRAR